MKGRLFVARNELERLIIEESLMERGVRYEIWRTREYPNGRVFHYWTSSVEAIKIKADLFRKAWNIFRKERRKQRVAAL